LKDTSIKVVEIVPPGVETDLSAGASFSKISVEDYGNDTIKQLLNDVSEIGYNNDNPKILRASRDELDVWFNSFNDVV
jgi:short-subunit dehydrogenase involved in D-alanine esterification of teichoic acids